MELIFLIILFYFLLFGYWSLSRRIKRVEKRIDSLSNQIRSMEHPSQEITEKVTVKVKTIPSSEPPAHPFEEIKAFQIQPEKPIVKKAGRQKPEQKLKMQRSASPFKIPDIIKENWMGAVGSVALVIGVVFFGLTSEFMQRPEARVGAMLLFSLLLVSLRFVLKNKEEWELVSGWFKSIAGAIVLFAALGAGGIKGLQFIEDPLAALAALSLGVAVNLALAFTTPSQPLASFHVILSIAALIAAPQVAVMLPLGTLVALGGLFLCFRSRWDVHLILIVTAYAVQNTVWTFLSGTKLAPELQILGIACSLTVGITAALVHYRKVYQSKKFEALPFAAHVTNWILLAWNILIHAQNVRWAPFILAGAAAAGFVLARVGRSKGIAWLFRTDTFLSQLVLLAAIAALRNFRIGALDLSVLAIAEIALFAFVCHMEREIRLVQGAYILLLAALIVNANLFFKMISKSPGDPALFFREAIVILVVWGMHYLGSLKGFVADTPSFIFMGSQDKKNPISVTAFFGAIIFFAAYFLSLQIYTVQAAVLVGLSILAYVRGRREDLTWNVVFLFLMALIHLFSWGEMTAALGRRTFPDLSHRFDLIGITLLDFILIASNSLEFKIWKKSLHDLFIYALGIQAGLLAYIVFLPVSAFLPGIIFLGFSLASLEVGKYFGSSIRFSEEGRDKVLSGFIHVGAAFIICFLIRFITVDLQLETFWAGFPLRGFIEILGLSTLIYWTLYLPKNLPVTKLNTLISEGLIEATLAFATLAILAEGPEFWRPFAWGLFALSLVLGTIRFPWPKRLLVYSWGYLIASIMHVAFVTASMTMPALSLFEKYHLPAYLAVALQFAYAIVVQGSRRKIRREAEASGRYLSKAGNYLFREPAVTVILPIFLGIASLFAFNYEKTVLTLMWVGLCGAYLSLGLVLRSKLSIQIAMGALLLCSIRLIAYDLVQSEIAVRALVFIGVGIVMLSLSIVYKKYKHRIDRDEDK